VTDGTSSGTSELAVAAADSSGVFDGARLSTSDFTVFCGKALFDGRDASGNNGLWVTDGTSAGTIELKAGLFSTGVSPGFTVLGGKVLFERAVHTSG
jgi:ELWxxDGT repeat protein